MLIVPVVVFLVRHEASSAAVGGGQATILPPNRVGGASGQNDQRDADVFPSVAYDAVSGRYLAVWLTPRHAGSSSDGFDVYGAFLNRAGQPTGSEFRISDSNTAARSSPPSVATGNGEFAVAWTVRGSPCRVYVQRVLDASSRSDRQLTAGAAHQHSPNLIYNSTRQRYLLAYADGNDYMPPTLFGAQTADCGNDSSSTGRIRALEFHFNGDIPVVGSSRDISSVTGGGFRPRIARGAALGKHLIVWEDRRNAGSQAYRFDVYAQLLSDDLSLTGSNFALASGGDYANYDTSATWTPRPAVSAGDDRFLAVWFAREAQSNATIWSVNGRFVSGNGSPQAVFTIARMTFAQSHTGQAPAGFLATCYLNAAQEYLVGMTTHLESLWGYLSLALIQRVDREGRLLKLDGSVRSQPGVGYSVDYDNDDQIGIGLTANPVGGVGKADYMVIYGKHAPGHSSQDFDIWGTRVQLPSPNAKGNFVPFIAKAKDSRGCLVESAHPYTNSFDSTWTLVNSDSRATATRIHFSRIDTERGYDFIYVKDESNRQINRFDGTYASGVWSDPIPGRIVKVQLTSDGSVTAWGFCVDLVQTVTAIR